MLEHGWKQQDSVVEVIESLSSYCDIERGVDLSGQPRYVLARRC
jgi:hypothetical protein